MLRDKLPHSTAPLLFTTAVIFQLRVAPSSGNGQRLRRCKRIGHREQPLQRRQLPLILDTLSKSGRFRRKRNRQFHSHHESCGSVCVWL